MQAFQPLVTTTTPPTALRLVDPRREFDLVFSTGEDANEAVLAVSQGDGPTSWHEMVRRGRTWVRRLWLDRRPTRATVYLRRGTTWALSGRAVPREVARRGSLDTAACGPRRGLAEAARLPAALPATAAKGSAARGSCGSGCRGGGCQTGCGDAEGGGDGGGRILQRMVRRNVCRQCNQRSEGVPWAGATASLPCEAACDLFQALPILAKEVTRTDPMIADPEKTASSLVDRLCPAPNSPLRIHRGPLVRTLTLYAHG